MCGLLLFFSDKVELSSLQFQKALALLNHRGPDHSEIWFGENRKATTLVPLVNFEEKNVQSNFFIGHNRLAIFDLSERGNQPFFSPDRSQFLAYNGEFYNFRDYDTTGFEPSDGRVLFDLLINQSVSAFDKVNGMWAAVYAQLQRRTIFLSRDRYGKKPLYFFQKDGVFIVSSEQKSIFSILSCLNLTSKKRKVTPEGVGRFLYGKLTPYDSEGINFYDQIRVVPPNTNLEFNMDQFSISKHSDVEWCELRGLGGGLRPVDASELYESIYSDIHDSVSLRLQSDAKIAISLSGGLDSSFITGCALRLLNKQNMNLFTCAIYGAGGKLNADSSTAETIAKALGADIQTVKNLDHSQESFLKTIFEITQYSELPINSLLSCIPVYQLTGAMKEKGIKVCLDGNGGDEIFGGYPSSASLALANASHGGIRQVMSEYFNWLRQDVPSSLAAFRFFSRIVKRRLFNRNMHIPMNEEILENLKQFSNANLKNAVLKLDREFFVRANLVNSKERQLFELQSYQMPFYLGTADTCSMMNSVENRSPFLDYRLIKYLDMKPNQKHRNGLNKFALRKAMPNNIPKAITWKKQKDGMSSSYNIRDFRVPKILEVINDSSFIRAIVSPDEIKADFLESQLMTRSLLSLSVIDHIYGIEF